MKAPKREFIEQYVRTFGYADDTEIPKFSAWAIRTWDRHVDFSDTCPEQVVETALSAWRALP